MATVAETLAEFDLLAKKKHRPTLYAGQWDALNTDLATLQDGAGSVVGAQSAVAALEAQKNNPTQYARTWDPVRAQIAVLADGI